MENSEIEWCHHTQNLWWGCTEVHEGCDNCYAKKLSHRWGEDVWGNNVFRLEIKSWEQELLKFQRKALEAGENHRVFIGSMMDISEKPKPLRNRQHVELGYTTGHLRAKLFEVVVPQCPNLDFLFLSKRPSNFNKYIPEAWKTNPPSNVIFGTSPVNQETANKLVPQLLEVKGRRFLSVEPQLEEINLKSWLNDIDWVIVGGESGPGKRPFDANWARTIRDQCKEANVPFFMKQMDKVKAIPNDLMIREFPEINKTPIINTNTMTMKSASHNKMAKTISSKMGPAMKAIAEALISGEDPDTLATRLSIEKNKKRPAVRAWVTMVQEKLQGNYETPHKKTKILLMPSNKEVQSAKKDAEETKTVHINAPKGQPFKIQLEIVLSYK
ncbi:MAG TPA: DUF5131 family protein [Bacteroidia bacterium]|jgi:protein gp37|nr:DUF5131 family protein [Bacteroidia bacterium]